MRDDQLVQGTSQLNYGAAEVAQEAPLSGRANADKLLDIAKCTDQFIASNGWSWCDMEQVYRILKVIHGKERR